ncbi:sterol carrier family protein [Streptomyces sp. NPDC059740]|uniref:maleylpyruvate isomerase family mycothiol-dependent enzyme n=1 Tax=Streptomyces sp. NPDC059740 TaxID=3346926 RepID=UPI003668A5F4
MPSATRRPRPRSYDLARTRTAVAAQLDNVRAAVRGLGEAEWERPTRLAGWDVRSLAAHVAFAVDSVAVRLAQPAPARQELALADWGQATVAFAAASQQAVREVEGADDPVARLDSAAARFAELVEPEPATRLLTTPVGAVRLDDYLVTRCVELAVHTDDLAAALGVDVPQDRQNLAAAVRMLADTLATQAPGGSVEVRVPPFAVVQCVAGPRHTRGTPPNVVEAGPTAWLRLATGRTGWAEAVADAQVSASGERADLSALLPLLS